MRLRTREAGARPVVVPTTLHVHTAVPALLLAAAQAGCIDPSSMRRSDATQSDGTLSNSEGGADEAGDANDASDASDAAEAMVGPATCASVNGGMCCVARRVVRVEDAGPEASVMYLDPDPSDPVGCYVTACFMECQLSRRDEPCSAEEIAARQICPMA